MKIFFATLAVVMLAACTQAPPQESVAPNFKQSPPLRLNVADIRVEENYQPPLARPNVEHEFPTPPARAIEEWARDRLQAAGATGTLILTIDDASVRETLPPKKTGISTLLEEPIARYDAKINATFRLYDGVHPLALAEASVNITRTRTLKSTASPDERERFYDQLKNDLMRDFNAQASKNLRQYFSAHLR